MKQKTISIRQKQRIENMFIIFNSDSLMRIRNMHVEGCVFMGVEGAKTSRDGRMMEITGMKGKRTLKQKIQLLLFVWRWVNK